MTRLRVGALFTGSGMLDMAVCEAVRGDTVWVVENDPAASRVLAHHWPNVPNHGDITAIDWAAVEPVGVLCGGFPCTDVSSAGKRAGLRPSTRSGLWSHMVSAISQLKPKLVVIENVRGLLSADAHCDLEPDPWGLGNGTSRPLRALGAVLGDLAQLGFDARWCGLRASDVGAPHGRFRVFITAWPVSDALGVGWGEGWPESAGQFWGSDAALGGDGTAAHPDGIGPVRSGRPRRRREEFADHGEPAADTDGDGLAGQPERHVGQIQPGQPTDWGAYEPAIRRWELILGRPAPPPTVTGKRGGQQLSAAFVEWMQGWPEGWVTSVPGLSRNDMLKICGNGVVPQQACAALRWLLTVGDVDAVA